ncbi:nucleolar protein 11-like [Clavelina lepadiformis]|uniref:Nucleolar protein 11 n=1 Tax=Clavelina lepadiformis TaxID=159417 RepID=A0ABP0G1R6_CLALP
MSLLGIKHVLLQTSKQKKFIDAVLKDDNIIITYNNNITIYDNTHKKICNSWTIGMGQQFTAAAVYNAADEEYVAVINSSVIKTFTEDNFSKTDKFTTNIPIHKLISRKGQPFVLFINGIVLPLGKVLEDPKEIPTTGSISSPIMMAELLSNDVVAVIFCQENKYFLTFSDGQGHCTFPVVKESLKLHCSCCCHKDSTDLLITVWEDGSICKSLIPTESDDTLTFESFSSVKTSASKRPGVITTLPNDMFAIISDENKALIIDTKYGVMHDNFEVLPNTQIISVGTNLLTVEEETVYARTFIPKPVTLSSVLGKRSNEAPAIPSVVHWGKKASKKGNPPSEEHMETLLKSSVEAELITTWDELWKATKPQQRQMVCSSTFMLRLLEKLTDKKAPWHPELLSKIISTKCISAKSCPNLFARILEKEDKNLLSKSFTHVKDIGEMDIVLSLNVILSTTKSLPDKETVLLLNEIIKLPFTEVKLRDELRKTNFEKAIVLLNHLGRKLKKTNLTSSIVDKIISWMCLILDAHFTQIMVTPNVWEYLIELQETVAAQVEMYNDLAEIDAILTKIKQSSTTTKKIKQFVYNVEVMLI